MLCRPSFVDCILAQGFLTTNVFITPLPSVEATKTATVSDVNGNSENEEK